MLSMSESAEKFSSFESYDKAMSNDERKMAEHTLRAHYAQIKEKSNMSWIRGIYRWKTNHKSEATHNGYSGYKLNVPPCDVGALHELIAECFVDRSSLHPESCPDDGLTELVTPEFHPFFDLDGNSSTQDKDNEWWQDVLHTIVKTIGSHAVITRRAKGNSWSFHVIFPALKTNAEKFNAQHQEVRDALGEFESDMEWKTVLDAQCKTSLRMIGFKNKSKTTRTWDDASIHSVACVMNVNGTMETPSWTSKQQVHHTSIRIPASVSKETSTKETKSDFHLQGEGETMRAFLNTKAPRAKIAAKVSKVPPIRRRAEKRKRMAEREAQEDEAPGSASDAESEDDNDSDDCEDIESRSWKQEELKAQSKIKALQELMADMFPDRGGLRIKKFSTPEDGKGLAFVDFEDNDMSRVCKRVHDRPTVYMLVTSSGRAELRCYSKTWMQCQNFKKKAKTTPQTMKKIVDILWKDTSRAADGKVMMYSQEHMKQEFINKSIEIGEPYMCSLSGQMYHWSPETKIYEAKRDTQVYGDISAFLQATMRDSPESFAGSESTSTKKEIGNRSFVRAILDLVKGSSENEDFDRRKNGNYSDLDEYPDGVYELPIADGKIFNGKYKTLRDRTPKDLWTFSLPWRYLHKTRHTEEGDVVEYHPLPIPKKVFDQMFALDPEIIPFLQMRLGMGCSGDCRSQYALWLVGGHNNGKSYTVNWFSKLLGKELAGTLDQKIIFSTSRSFDSSTGARPEWLKLIGKRFLANTESDKNSSVREEIYRILTSMGTDELPEARTLYSKELETIRPRALVTFCVNTIPPLLSGQQSNQGRTAIVPCRSTYDPQPRPGITGTPGHYLQDRVFDDLKSSEQGMNEFFTWCMDGMYKSLQTCPTRPLLPDCMKVALNDFVQSQNPVAEWAASEFFDEKNEQKHTFKELHDHYNAWRVYTGADSSSMLNHPKFREALAVINKWAKKFAHGQNWYKGPKLLAVPNPLMDRGLFTSISCG